MNHILIEFPVFDGAFAEEPISIPRSVVPSHGGCAGHVGEQTKLPPPKATGNENRGQLVGAAKAVFDYYGPVVDGLSVEAREYTLFHLLEIALAPFLREPANRGTCLTRPVKPHLAKIHVMPKLEPVMRELIGV
jgi:hypothetical protein